MNGTQFAVVFMATARQVSVLQSMLAKQGKRKSKLTKVFPDLEIDDVDGEIRMAESFVPLIGLDNIAPIPCTMYEDLIGNFSTERPRLCNNHSSQFLTD